MLAKQREVPFGADHRSCRCRDVHATGPAGTGWTDDRGDAPARLSAIVEGCDDAIIATRLDGVITAWSPGAEDIYGYRADQVIGRHISLLHPGGDTTVVDQILEGVGRGQPSGIIEGRRLSSNGTTVDVEFRVSPIRDETGQIIGSSCIARDIGERLLREQELRESRQFLERTQQIGHIGSWKTQVGPEQVFTWTAETYRILGIDEGAPVRNMDFFDMVHPDDRQSLLDAMVEVRSSGERAEVELRFTRADGQARWLLLAAEAQYEGQGAAVAMTGVVQDITERKQAQARLAHDALHDGLTGLPNRELFLDRITSAVQRGLRSGSKVAVLYIDLDRFRLFNEMRGRAAGDALLETVADRLRATFRLSDSVACFGADEYGVVCEGVATAAAAADRAERVLRALGKPFALEGGDALVTASIGIAISDAGVSAEDLLRDAGLAMHRAKERGRSRFELYDPVHRQQLHDRYSLESALRRALKRDEFFLEFQPIFSAKAGRFVGAEALLRWCHPDRGVIGPDQFIPIAEDTGLINPIGARALESACRQLRDWRDAAPGMEQATVSVNVAAVQLQSSEIVETIDGALRKTGLEPAALCLELTESALIDDGVLTDTLERIRQLGVRISIDDFGTKYSSLAYVSRLPIDELKIDRSFVKNLIGVDSDRAVISAILAIGRSLGLHVTAEGVETQAQYDELCRLGCESMQGFYLAKPLPPDHCLATLRSGPCPASTW